MDGYFADLYFHTGQPSICPECLLRGSLLKVFYAIRSERLLLEQLDYNLLFRCFAGLSADDPVWDHSVFSKSRGRLLNTEMASFFFATIRDQARQKELVNDEHFSVEATLLETWASMKSFRPKTWIKKNTIPARDAILRSIFRDRSEATKPMPPPPIRG